VEDRSSIEARSRGAPGGAAESRLAAAAGLVVAQIVVFVVGMRTPLGIAEWIVYLAPVAASMLLASPRLPLALASTSTVLIALGYFLSPPGALPAGIARMNRTIGVVVIWVVAAMVWRAVLLKLDVQRDRWLKAGQARLAESIRGLRDPATLAERVAGEVASRLGAQTAALFVTRDGERYELVGGYALPSERRRQRPAFAAGTGLVGQAARDRRWCASTTCPRAT